MSIPKPAPDWQIQRWFNTAQPLTLSSLRGKVIVLEAFQMLCPGCVSHGLPQAQRIRAVFAPEEVAVIGLHAVFEHHAVMNPDALQAFLHEYRISFPVAVDLPSSDGPIPHTMRAYAMRGTPSLLLIDRTGQLRHHHFGQVEDLLVGAQIASLLHTNVSTALPAAEQADATSEDRCDDDGCKV